MIEIRPISDFNLYHTLNCGQAFRWHEDNGWFYGVVGTSFLRICQKGESLFVESSDESDPIKLQQSLWYYFDLGRDLSRIFDLINKDHYMETSIEACRGMRIMNQDWLKNQSYSVAKQELMSLKGIGDKVAACISLFSLGHGEALPIDVWVRKIAERLYLKRKASKRQILEFFHDYFGEHIGYAQQYLFHYARTIGFKELLD